jgi:hypothetical protein
MNFVFLVIYIRRIIDLVVCLSSPCSGFVFSDPTFVFFSRAARPPLGQHLVKFQNKTNKKFFSDMEILSI